MKKTRKKLIAWYENLKDANGYELVNIKYPLKTFVFLSVQQPEKLSWQVQTVVHEAMVGKFSDTIPINSTYESAITWNITLCMHVAHQHKHRKEYSHADTAQKDPQQGCYNVIKGTWLCVVDSVYGDEKAAAMVIRL